MISTYTYSDYVKFVRYDLKESQYHSVRNWWTLKVFHKKFLIFMVYLHIQPVAI